MRLLEVGLVTELPADEDLEDPLCGNSRLEVETFERVVVEVPSCVRLPDEGFNMELFLDEDMEDTLRLPGEGELAECFLLEELLEIP